MFNVVKNTCFSWIFVLHISMKQCSLKELLTRVNHFHTLYIYWSTKLLVVSACFYNSIFIGPMIKPQCTGQLKAVELIVKCVIPSEVITQRWHYNVLKVTKACYIITDPTRLHVYNEFSTVPDILIFMISIGPSHCFGYRPQGVLYDFINNYL